MSNHPPAFWSPCSCPKLVDLIPVRLLGLLAVVDQLVSLSLGVSLAQTSCLQGKLPRVEG